MRKITTMATIAILTILPFIGGCKGSPDDPLGLAAAVAVGIPTEPGDNPGGGSEPTFNGLNSAIVTGVDTLTLSWTAATDDVSDSANIVYDIFQASTAGGQVFGTPTHTTAAGATSFNVTGLARDTDYFFVVRARDEAGNSDTNTTETQKQIETLFVDDFEDQATTGWSISGSSGSVVANITPPDDSGHALYPTTIIPPGSKCMQFNVTSDFNAANVTTTFSAINPTYVGFYYRNHYGQPVKLNFGDGTNNIFSAYRANDNSNVGEIHYGDGSVLALGSHGAVWVHYEFKNINWLAQTFDIWIDGVETGTGLDFIAAASTVTALTELDIYLYWEMEGEIQIDEIYMLK